MKLLVYTPAFTPSVGGLELATALLVEDLSRLGCEVVVATTTPAGAPEEPGATPYRIVRRPSPRALFALARWCDVYYQANVSLRGLWPLLLVRRPWVVSHHSWYCRTDGRIAWRDRLKRFLLRYAAASVAVSRAMAADLTPPPLVIGNTYRDDLFHPLPGIPRDRELVAVGRLVSDKGFDLLLDALALLEKDGLRPRLTLIGDGPERPALAAQAARLGLADRVTFTGRLGPEEVARELNRHQLLVVPSCYREPFGNVALEGIACGCAVVASSGGGLPEAVGPCGKTFPNGDLEALAAALGELLRAPAARSALLEGAPAHLAEHSRKRVAELYLSVIERAASAGAAVGEAA